ncbi:hypothetical protein N302_04133, partial [Corvus brachyrhynchos]
AQGIIKELELSFSISFEFSPDAGSTAETKEHAEWVALALSMSCRLCFNAGVFEALWEAFLGCVVACMTWLVERRLLTCSLWGLFTGNSTLISLARSTGFFCTFIEDNCLGEPTREGEETDD